jgi:hypothetical protein
MPGPKNTAQHREASMGSSSMRNYLDPVMHLRKLQSGNVSSSILAVIFLHQEVLRNQKIPLPQLFRGPRLRQRGTARRSVSVL